MLSGRRTFRRRAQPAFALIAALLASTACTSGGATPAPTTPGVVDHRPNIVFVLTDDLTSNLIPYMPHVQALMQRGSSLRNYFVVDSLCCPSRAAIFTGQYPHNNGVYTNEGYDGGFAAYNEFGNPPKSFAMGLHNAGYRTGFLGKYLNGFHATDPEPPGWDEFAGTGGAYKEYNYQLNENGDVHSYGSAPSDYLTHVLAGKGRDFIRSAAQSGHPFALEVATFAPHAPAEPAPMDKGTFAGLHVPKGPTFDRRPVHPVPWLARLGPLTTTDIATLDQRFTRRVASVQAVDRMIGQLELELVQQHKLDNTYFVFSSDNGFHMGNYQMLSGKQTAFDTDIRVPLIVTGPGVPAGRTIDAMSSSIDLAPTFLQIAGAQPTDRLDGISLLPLLHGEPAPPRWQRAVLIEHHGPVTSPLDPDAQPVGAGWPPSYEAMRSVGSLYVEYVTGDREYYDLRRDPNELDNRVGDLSKRKLDALHAALQRLVLCSGTTQCQRAASLSPAA